MGALGVAGQNIQAQDTNANVRKVVALYRSEGKDMEKNMYLLGVINRNCNSKIRVNDVLMLSSRNGTDVLLPLNSALLANGKQTVTVEMYPLEGKNTLGQAITFLELLRFPKGSISKWVTFKTIKSTDYIEIEDVSNLASYEYSETFEAENLPAECVGWKRFVELNKEDKYKLQKELYAEYQRIYDIVQRKDLDAFISVIKEGEALIDKMNCFIEKDIYTRSFSIVNFIEKENRWLRPLPPFGETALQFEGYGRLVSLVDKDGHSIIQNWYYDACGNRVIHSLDFRFHRKNVEDKLEAILLNEI